MIICRQAFDLLCKVGHLRLEGLILRLRYGYTVRIRLPFAKWRYHKRNNIDAAPPQPNAPGEPRRE